jgi:hypothetical protein
MGPCRKVDSALFNKYFVVVVVVIVVVVIKSFETQRLPTILA